MNHAKILRTLALPLIVMLGICIVLVVAAPLTRFRNAPEPKMKTVQSAAPSNSANGEPSPGDAAQPAQIALPESDSAADGRSSDAKELPLDGSGEIAPSQDKTQAVRSTDSVSFDPRSFDLVMATLADQLEKNVADAAGYRTESPLTTTQVVSLEQPIPDEALDANTDPPVEPSDTNSPVAARPVRSAAAGSVSVETEKPSHFEHVKIHNPPENGYPVAFVINGAIVNLAPGESHLTAQRPWSLGFDRGGGKGPVRKTLAAGQYDFRLTSDGWTLESRSPDN